MIKIKKLATIQKEIKRKFPRIAPLWKYSPSYLDPRIIRYYDDEGELVYEIPTSKIRTKNGELIIALQDRVITQTKYSSIWVEYRL